jgi:hypothetical protein
VSVNSVKLERPDGWSSGSEFCGALPALCWWSVALNSLPTAESCNRFAHGSRIEIALTRENGKLPFGK